MKSADDGGTAFPALQSSEIWDEKAAGYRDVYQPHGGMTLRDYFAAWAMHAELATAGALAGPRDAFIAGMNEHGHTAEEHLAYMAYRSADAMIAQRKKLVP